MAKLIIIACGITSGAFQISPMTAWLWGGLLVVSIIWAKVMGLIFYDWFADRSAWLDSLRLTIGTGVAIGLCYSFVAALSVIQASLVSLILLDYLNLRWIIKQRTVKPITHDSLGQLKVIDSSPRLYESPAKIAVMINLFALVAAIFGSISFLFLSYVFNLFSG